MKITCELKHKDLPHIAKGKFWQKEVYGGELDRYYIDIERLIGFDEVDRYKTGNVKYAVYNGSKISNSKASQKLNFYEEAKCFYDFVNGCFSVYALNKSAQENMVDIINEKLTEHKRT